MGKTVKPLNDTLIKSSKPKEDDYTLSDGNGLYMLIKKMAQRYGDLIISIQYPIKELWLVLEVIQK